MRLTVDDAQSQIAAVLDQDEATANISATDYSLRLKYLNMAQKEWADSYDWKNLFSEYNMLVSTSTGNASIALPNDFNRLGSYPRIAYNGTDTSKFPEVLPQDDNQFSDTDKRIWILGSPQNGYVMRVFAATLSSGASVKVPYFRSPVSLVSPANIPDIPNVDYLVKRTIAYVWEAREDTRFPQMKAEAERILANMLEVENNPNRASDWDHVKTVEQTKYNFRWGRS